MVTTDNSPSCTPSSAELQRLHDIITTARRTTVAKPVSHTAQGRRLDFGPPTTSPVVVTPRQLSPTSSTDNSPAVTIPAPRTANRGASRMVLLSEESDGDGVGQEDSTPAAASGVCDEQYYSLSSSDDLVITRVVHNATTITPQQQVATSPTTMPPGVSSTVRSHGIVHVSSSSDSQVYIAPPRSTARKAQRLAISSDDDKHEQEDEEEGRAPKQQQGFASSSGNRESPDSGNWNSSDHHQQTIPAGLYMPLTGGDAPTGAPQVGVVPRRVRTAGQSAATFARARHALAQQLYADYNACAFDGRLPNDLVVSWSKHLKTTAGVTHYSRTILPSTAHPRSSLGQAPADDSYAACPSGAGSVAVGDAGADALASDAVSTTTTTSSPPFLYTARIELSTKVLDNEAKLRRTLVHEMCHAAAWLLDHTAKPPHGPVFRKWAARVMARCPDLEVTTCHNYEIFYAFRWQCTNSWCGKVYGRHSNSLDVNTKVCGVCRGRLVALGRVNPDGTPAAARGPTPYAKFVKEHFSTTKARCPAGTPHKEVMRVLADDWKARKGGGDGGHGGSSTSQQQLDDLEERFSRQVAIANDRV